MTTDQNLRVDIANEMRRTTGMEPVQDDAEQPAAAVGGRVSADERRRLIASERQRVLAVVDACALAKRSDLAGGFIASGASLSSALEVLEKARRTARGPAARN